MNYPAVSQLPEALHSAECPEDKARIIGELLVDLRSRIGALPGGQRVLIDLDTGRVEVSGPKRVPVELEHVPRLGTWG